MKTLEKSKKQVVKAPKNGVAPRIKANAPSEAEIAEDRYVDEMGERLLAALNRGSHLAREENERLGLT